MSCRSLIPFQPLFPTLFQCWERLLKETGTVKEAEAFEKEKSKKEGQSFPRSGAAGTGMWGSSWGSRSPGKAGCPGLCQQHFGGRWTEMQQGELPGLCSAGVWCLPHQTNCWDPGLWHSARCQVSASLHTCADTLPASVLSPSPGRLFAGIKGQARKNILQAEAASHGLDYFSNMLAVKASFPVPALMNLWICFCVFEHYRSLNATLLY